MTDVIPAVPERMRVKDILALLKKAKVTVIRTTFDRWREQGTFPNPDYRIGNSPVWTMVTFKGWLQQCIDNATKG